MVKYQKIAIIGGPGTGKTTLAENLKEKLKLPVYHLDGIHHLPNWVKRNEEERDSIILGIAKQEEWIIEGNYISTLKERLQQADIIIFLEYSTLARVKGILERYLKNRNAERQEIPGCKEKMDLTFFNYTRRWNKKVKPGIKKIIKESINNQKVIIFSDRKQLNKWMMENFN